MPPQSPETLAQIDSEISKLRAQLADGKCTGISQVELQHLLGERSKRITEIATTPDSQNSPAGAACQNTAV